MKEKSWNNWNKASKRIELDLCEEILHIVEMNIVFFLPEMYLFLLRTFKNQIVFPPSEFLFDFIIESKYNIFVSTFDAKQ